MLDTTIHARTLERCLTASDFLTDPTLRTVAARKDLIERASVIGRTGYYGVSLTSNTLRGKPVHQFTDLAALLVARQLSSNITRITSSKQENRSFIIDCVRSLCKEAVPFSVFKFDIHSFYESIDTQHLLSKLEGDIAFSGQSYRLIHSLIGELHSRGIAGLPRGLAISAVLSEYLMRDFDSAAKNQPNVWFYARFVDDIIMFTKSDYTIESMSNLLASHLPPGLRFNKKSCEYHFGEPKKHGSKLKTDGTFSFLGYAFHLSQCYRDPVTNRWARDVQVDISPNKVRRFKTRIARSLLSFSNDSSYDDLRDRVRLLTSNYSYHDYKKGVDRKAGIYFNYPHASSTTSTALNELDAFLRNSIASPHPLNRLRPTLSCKQRNELLRLGFKDGHATKRFFSFSPARIAHLNSCWQYA